MKLKQVSRSTLALIVSLVSAPVASAAGVEWVDMGPLNGSAQGRAWSKVVDEVGNIVGRNEIWKVKLPAQAFVEVIVKCPDPGALGVTVKWKTEYGEALEWGVEQAKDGFRHKFSMAWNPANQKDITIVVATRRAPTDQMYQVICNLYDAAGKPIGRTAVAPASPKAHPSVAGAWRFVAGHPKGSVITIQQRPDGTVTSIICRSVFANGDRGVNKATRIAWDNATTLTYSYTWTEKSTSDLRDGEASIVFDSETSASIGARDAVGNSARDVLRKD